MTKKEKQIICPICNNKLSFLKAKLKDDIKVCSKHVVNEAGIVFEDTIKNSTVEDINERIHQRKSNQEKTEKEIESFVVTKQLGESVKFDDENEQILIPNHIQPQFINYSDIINFELLEDGEVVTSGGLGRALAGGVLFGGTGAIVGAVTGKKKGKNFCDSLKIKITTKNAEHSAYYITFINKKIKTSSTEYGLAYNQAQEALSTFQLICDKRDNYNAQKETNNIADEIMKFKQLLDADAITQEEYEEKKKELLGL